VQLTKQTDYALRLLIYLAAVGRRVSIAEVAEAQGISRTHLMKIANLLTVRGFIAAARGRGEIDEQAQCIVGLLGQLHRATISLPALPHATAFQARV